MGNVTDETKRNRNRKTEPGVAKPAGRMDADDLFADDTSDIDVPVYRKEKGATDSGGESTPNKPRRDIYDVLGRARPQRIAPQRPEPAKQEPSQLGLAEPKEVEPEPARPEATAPESAKAEANNQGVARSEQSEQTKPAPLKAESSAPKTAQSDFKKTSPSPAGAARPLIASAEQPTTVLPANKGAAGEGETRSFESSEFEQNRGERKAPASDAVDGSSTGDGTAQESHIPAGAGTPDPTTVDASDEGDTVSETSAHDKRGTMGFGLFLLRVVAGALLLIYGLQTLFAFGGNPGLNSLEGLLSQYKFADLLAVGLSIGQVAAGGLLILGLVTPVGAAIGAVVSAFLTGHYLGASGGNLWPYAMSPQSQLWGLLALICMALIFTGPGRISVDRNRGWARRPLASAWIFALIAVGGAAALWLIVGGGNPVH